MANGAFQSTFRQRVVRVGGSLTFGDSQTVTTPGTPGARYTAENASNGSFDFPVEDWISTLGTYLQVIPDVDGHTSIMFVDGYTGDFRLTGDGTGGAPAPQFRDYTGRFDVDPDQGDMTGRVAMYKQSNRWHLQVALRGTRVRYRNADDPIQGLGLWFLFQEQFGTPTIAVRDRQWAQGDTSAVFTDGAEYTTLHWEGFSPAAFIDTTTENTFTMQASGYGGGTLGGRDLKPAFPLGMRVRIKGKFKVGTPGGTSTVTSPGSSTPPTDQLRGFQSQYRQAFVRDGGAMTFGAPASGGDGSGGSAD